MLKGGGGVAQGRANNGGARMEMFRCDTRVTYGRGQARHAIGAGRGQARQDACCGTQTCNGAPAFMHARQGLGRVVRWQWARESREKAARKARRRRRAGWRVRGRGGGDGGGRCGGTEACSGMRGRRRAGRRGQMRAATEARCYGPQRCEGRPRAQRWATRRRRASQPAPSRPSVPGSVGPSGQAAGGLGDGRAMLASRM